MPSSHFPFHATLGVQLPNGSSIPGSWDILRKVAPWTIEHVSFAVTTSEDPASSERLLEVEFREADNYDYHTLERAVHSENFVRLADRNRAAKDFRDQDNEEREKAEEYYESCSLKAQLDRDKNLTESRQVELAIGSGIVTGSLLVETVKGSAVSLAHFFKLFEEFRIGKGDSREPTTVMIDFKKYQEGPACLSVGIGSKDRSLLKDVITAVEKALGGGIGCKYKLAVIRHLGFRHCNSTCAPKFRPPSDHGQVTFCEKKTKKYEAPADFVYRLNKHLKNHGNGT